MFTDTLPTGSVCQRYTEKEQVETMLVGALHLLAATTALSSHSQFAACGRRPASTGIARAARPVAQLFGEGDYDGECDEYADALAMYEKLKLADGGLFGISAPEEPEDDEDDTTPEMMLELSMQRLEELTGEKQSSPEAMQAAVAAAIDAAAKVEAAKPLPNASDTSATLSA